MFLAFLLAGPAARALDVAYTLEGCPPTVTGHAGEVKTFNVFVALTTSGNATGRGAEGWSIGVAADGATIKAISLAGLQVSTIFDADGDPDTPPVNPSIFDLGTLDSSHTGSALATRPADGKQGGYSYAVLSSSAEKRVLQPSGTVRLARVTVEVTIPSGTTASTATIGFINGLKSPGQTVKNTTVFAGLNHDPTLGSCSVELEPITDTAFGFDGCPGLVSGQAGEVKTFDVYATLTTTHNIDPLGAEGWSMGVIAQGVTIKAISVSGVQVSTIFNDDGEPGTPPVNPDIFDLGELVPSGSAGARLATRPADGKKGAISFVVLSSSAEKRVLQPNGTVRMARITLEAVIPNANQAAQVSLRFENGLPSSGQTVKNTAVFGGFNFTPSLGSCSFFLSPGTEVVYGFEACPGVIAGHPGEIKTFDIFTTLTTSHNVSSIGAEGWSLGVIAEGVTIKAISLDGLQVSTIFDHDGEPATPPQNPSIFDLGTLDANHSGAGLATRPADGKQGAYSYVVLSSSAEKRVLQPNGSARIARLTVEATIPAGPETHATLRFENGLRGAGQSIKNTTVFGGLNEDPLLGTCDITLSSETQTSLAITGAPAQVSGDVGQVKTFDVFVSLTTSNNAEAVGAEGWSIGVTADGAEINAMTLKGVQVSTILDADLDPGTPPVNPSLLDLGDLLAPGLARGELATRPADGKQGGVSFAVLSGSGQKRWLQPNGVAQLAKVTVEVTIPPEPGLATLQFENGLKGSGQPVKNTIVFGGFNINPTTGSVNIPLLPPTERHFQLPGDGTQDNLLDISDAIYLINYLYLGLVVSLPCGPDHSLANPSNFALLNFNGDDQLDVSDLVSIIGFMFLGGPPHPLGMTCTEIAGCASVCH